MKNKLLNILDWAFYIIGVLFIETVLHELYHWLFCRGGFAAGIAYLNGELIVGTTWCALDNGGGGELFPTLVFDILFPIGMIILKLKKDKAA